jgi:hypothetical protein
MVIADALEGDVDDVIVRTTILSFLKPLKLMQVFLGCVLLIYYCGQDRGGTVLGASAWPLLP